MNATLKKLGFIHRRLWDRDGLYPLAVLLGPASLFGCLMAGILWQGILAVGAMNNHPLPWAVPEGSRQWTASDGQSHTVQPSRSLPSITPDGNLTGFEPGWRAAINPIEVSATSDVDVKTAVLANFPLDGSRVDMERLLYRRAQKFAVRRNRPGIFGGQNVRDLHTISAPRASSRTASRLLSASGIWPTACNLEPEAGDLDGTLDDLRPR